MDTTNEPVAWMQPDTLECGHGGNVDWEDTGCIPLYRHPSEHDLGVAEAIGFDKGYQAATAKTLSKDEIIEIRQEVWDDNKFISEIFFDFARAILKKASEK
jgi:hypothetical protein